MIQSATQFDAAPIAELPHGSPAALTQALDMVSDGVLFLDEQLTIVAANAAAVDRLCDGCPTLSDLPLTELMGSQSAVVLVAACRGLLVGEATLEMLSLERRQLDGTAVTLQMVVQRVADDTNHAFVAVIRPQDRQPATSDRVPAARFQRDFLTGLATRAGLAARLRGAQRRARKHGGQFAVLFIDVDRFKVINDTQGHDVGDQVLQALANRLLAAVRPGDLVARFSGDEFVVVVEDIHNPRQAEQIARRIRAAVTAPVEVDGVWIAVGASVGRAIGDASARAEEVLRQADRSMYRVKRVRRNRAR